MVNWIKKNKVVTLLIVLFLLFISKDYLFGFFGLPRYRLSAPQEELMYGEVGEAAPPGLTFQKSIGIIPPIPGREAPPTEGEDRLVIEESSMSLVVKSVRGATDEIVDHSKSVGGYMVSSSLTSPEEAPFATVVVRVPADNLRSSLDYFRSLAVKVTSENILGTDVTDEYVDIEARLETLETTKAKFEEIMAKAVEVQDILEVQRQLTYIQDQIDNLKGRQKYLEQTAKLAKITVYLSTDEYALPYAPSEAFRPQVIFKLAVRSLVRSLRSLAKVLIWIGVYGVIWVPIGVIVFFVWRWWKKRKV